MKYFPMSLIALIALAALPARAQDYDLLARQQIPVQNSNPERAVLGTMDDPRGVFQLYQPQMDSNSQLVSPLQVSGPRQSPRLQMSVRKCVAIMCQTVDLDAQVAVAEVSGPCLRNFTLSLDLSRSGQTLTDVYDQFLVSICYQQKNGGVLEMTARARRAGSYSTGLIQREIFSLLQAQTAPLTKALTAALKSH